MKWIEKVAKLVAYLTLLSCTAVYYLDMPIWKMFLFKDFNSLDFSVLMNQKNNSLGSVYALQGSGLKRKTDDEGFFNNININSNVFDGDVLITDGSTKTVIKFSDGSQLEINPQSMVKIEFEKTKNGLLSISKTPKIQVLKGEVADVGLKQLAITKVAQPKKIAKKVDLVKTKISTAQITRAIPKREIAQVIEQKIEPVEMEEAPPKIEAPAPVQLPKVPAKLVQAPKPQPKVVAKESPLKQVLMEQPLIAGLKGLNNNSYNGEDLKNFFVDLTWEPYYQASAYLVKFFQNGQTKEVWFSAKTQENKYRLNQMFNGQLDYEVEAYKGNQKVGVSKPQTINFNYSAPALKNPQHNSELNSEDMKYLFTWEKKNFTTEYIVEIAKDPKFEKAYKKISKENFLQIPLISGTYYWRVFSKNGETVSTPSSVNKIVVKKDAN